MKLLAQTPIGTFEGLGPLGKLDPMTPVISVFSQFSSIVSTTIGVLTVAGGIWFIFQIFSGAFQWLASGGEKQALQNAQKRITNAVVGLFMVIISYALIGIIGKILGFNILSPLKALLGIP